MLNFSFSTVLMTLLTSNILATVIALLFLHGKTMARVGYRVLTLLVIVTVIRLLFPFELPFSTNLYMPRFLSWAVASFRQHWITFFSIRLSLWNIFVLIWVGGIGVHIARYLSDHRHIQDHIQKYGIDKTDDSRYQKILNDLCRQHGRENRFRVIELSGLKIPMIYGHRNPCIVLPDHLSLTSEQRYYVLAHEAMHYFHYDFLIKGAMRLLSVLYWWNPACALLYRQTNTLLEMNIDKKITQSASDSTMQYAECLLYIQKMSLTNAPQLPRFIERDGCFFAPSKETELKRRITMLLHASHIWQKMSSGMIIALSAAGIYLLSYCFILEAAYLPTEISRTYTVPTVENTYAIKINSSTYEVYINGSYWGIETSLEYYPDGIKIYNQKGDLIDEN